MKRRARFRTAFTSVVVAMLLMSPGAVLLTPPVLAVEEPDRLWLVGERAAADNLHPIARRALERFVQEYPKDPRLPDAVLLLGRTRLALGDVESALEAFRRAQTFSPAPGRPQEAKFWEAEALFRLKRFSEARAAYDVARADAAGPLAADALYGYAWTELELGHPEPARKAFREFLAAWPSHVHAPSVTFQLARALVEEKQFGEAVPLLQGFRGSWPNHKLAPDAHYMLGVARVHAGDARAGLTDLRAFVEAHPSHASAPDARRLIARTMARHGDHHDFATAYTALMAESPATPDGLAAAAAIAARLGRTRDQEAAWRKLRTAFPDHPLALNAALDLATAAFKRKDWKETVTHAQAAARSEDDTIRAEALLLTGEAELKLRRFGPAEKAFEAASGVKTVDAAVRYRALAGLGLAREEQREWRGALAAYESVAASSPDPTLRDWAKERVNAVKARISKAPDKPASDKPAPQKAPKGGS